MAEPGLNFAKKLKGDIGISDSGSVDGDTLYASNPHLLQEVHDVVEI